jgi:hypothetical protein
VKAIFIASLLFLFSVPVFAKPVVLGIFDKDEYAYDDAKLFYDGNVVLVWVGTKSLRFNYSNDPDYAGALGRFAIDCSGHTSVFIEGFTFDKQGKQIQHGSVPEAKWIFQPIIDHTPQYTLYRRLCAEHPIM